MPATRSLPLVLAIVWTCVACSSESDAPTSAGETAGDPVAGDPPRADLGDRPAELLAGLADGALKRTLAACDASAATRSPFSIAHRGAPLRLPEHSLEGYLAAVEQGAGIVECDVSFTADGEPVCRHSRCDLHTTTDILATDLAAACEVAPTPGTAAPFAGVRCCTSDVRLAEFRSLRAKRDGADEGATTLERYLAGTPGWRDAPAEDYATLASLADAIALLEPLGVAFTPELKAFEAPAVGLDREAQSRRMFDAFRAAGVAPERVYPQSFALDDIRLWRRIEPDYAARSVWLDGRYRDVAIDPDDASGLLPDFATLARDAEIAYLAPPIWMLLRLDASGEIVPSDYALRARAAGLALMSWSLERGAELSGGGFYYQSVAAAWNGPSDQLRALEVLANGIGVEGVFSDWPATTTWFAHCALGR